MKVEEAIKLLENTDHLHEPPNGYYEALDMAIEALRNEINCVKCVHYTERETPTGIKGVCKMDTAHREELISRSGAIKDISYWATNIIDPKMLVKEDALYILETLPSVDAVEVVRCKDCKHWHQEIHNGIEYFNFSSCDLNHYGDGHNFYCADGERRING